MLTLCGKDKNAMLGTACSLVAAAEEVSRKIRVETPRTTYQEREDAWESSSEVRKVSGLCGVNIVW